MQVAGEAGATVLLPAPQTVSTVSLCSSDMASFCMLKAPVTRRHSHRGQALRGEKKINKLKFSKELENLTVKKVHVIAIRKKKVMYNEKKGR